MRRECVVLSLYERLSCVAAQHDGNYDNPPFNTLSRASHSPSLFIVIQQFVFIASLIYIY